MVLVLGGLVLTVPSDVVIQLLGGAVVVLLVAADILVIRSLETKSLITHRTCTNCPMVGGAPEFR